MPVSASLSSARKKPLDWGILLRAAGSLGGLAALTYLIGLVPYWIRLSSLGFPADVALHVSTQQQLLQEGLSPALVWAAITAVSAMLLAGSLIKVSGVHVWWITLPLLALGVAILGFTPLWWAFGFTTAMFLAVACGAISVRLRGPLGLPLLVVVAIISAAVGVCLFQVGESLTIEEVLVTPPVNDASAGTLIPYFGELDGYVYLAQPFVNPAGEHRFSFQIITCQRSSFSLTFVPSSESLFNPIGRNPWEVLANLGSLAAPGHPTPTKTDLPSYADCGMPATYHGSSDRGGGVIPIPDTATYTYRVSTVRCGLDAIPADGDQALRLTSDDGRVEYLVGANGTVYLTPGNWTLVSVIHETASAPGSVDTICAAQSWDIALTSTR